jgi:hypothetical protein
VGRNPLTGQLSGLSTGDLCELYSEVVGTVCRVLKLDPTDALEKKLRLHLQGSWKSSVSKALDTHLAPFSTGSKPITRLELRKFLGDMNLSLSTPLTLSQVATANGLLKGIYNNVKKAQSGQLKIPWSFTQKDAKAIAALGKHQVFWVGNLYSEHLANRVSGITSDLMLDSGLGRKQAGKLLRRALERETGLVPGGASGIASHIPAQFAGNPDNYFIGVASTIAQQGRTFARMNTFVTANVKTYTLTNPGDERTGQICNQMNGQVFTVTSGVEHMEKILDASDPADVKKIAPWLTGSKVEQTLAGTKPGSPEATAALQGKGLLLPPFHFRCRTKVVVHEFHGVPKPGKPPSKPPGKPPTKPKPKPKPKPPKPAVKPVAPKPVAPKPKPAPPKKPRKPRAPNFGPTSLPQLRKALGFSKDFGPSKLDELYDLTSTGPGRLKFLSAVEGDTAAFADEFIAALGNPEKLAELQLLADKHVAFVRKMETWVSARKAHGSAAGKKWLQRVSAMARQELTGYVKRIDGLVHRAGLQRIRNGWADAHRALENAKAYSAANVLDAAPHRYALPRIEAWDADLVKRMRDSGMPESALRAFARAEYEISYKARGAMNDDWWGVHYSRSHQPSFHVRADVPLRHRSEVIVHEAGHAVDRTLTQDGMSKFLDRMNTKSALKQATGEHISTYGGTHQLEESAELVTMHLERKSYHRHGRFSSMSLKESAPVRARFMEAWFKSEESFQKGTTVLRLHGSGKLSLEQTRKLLEKHIGFVE